MLRTANSLAPWSPAPWSALVLSLALAVSAVWARPVAAQDTPTAETVASLVQTFYDQTRTMSARFTQRFLDRGRNTEDVSRGQVRFKKPGMLRFDYDPPNGQIIASAGDRILAYEPPGRGESEGQYYEQSMAQAELPDAFSFLTGTGQLAPNYTFRLLHQTQYEHGYVLEMRPRRPSPHYVRLMLYVDSGARAPALRGIVHRVVIVDGAGNTNRFDFERQRVNAEIPDATFRYAPPAGARRVEAGAARRSGATPAAAPRPRSATTPTR